VRAKLVIARRSFLNDLAISWMVLPDCPGEAYRKGSRAYPRLERCQVIPTYRLPIPSCNRFGLSPLV